MVHWDIHPAAAALDPCAQITADSTALADAAAGKFSAPVVHCPGWTLADLVYHLYGVQHFWRRIVSDRLQPDQIDYPARPAGAMNANADAAPLRASVTLDAADGDTTWLIEDAPGGLRWRRGGGASVSQLRGTASDLLLWLYGRTPSNGLVSGDPAVLDRLRAHLNTD